MSNRELAFFLRMKDEASHVWEKTKGTVQQGVSQLKSSFGGLGGIIAGPFSIYAIKDFIKASNEQEVATAKLAQALRNAGVSGEETRMSMENFSNAMMKATTFGDEVVGPIRADQGNCSDRSRNRTGIYL